MCRVEDALDSTGFGFCKVNAIGAKKGYCNVGVFGGDCCCPVAKPCQTLCDPMDCSTPGSLSFPISWSLLRFMSTESMMLSNHLVLCFTLLLFAFNLSQHQGLFQWTGSLHQVAKYWSCSFSINPSNEFQDWFPLGFIGLIFLQGRLSRIFGGEGENKNIKQ